MRRKLFFVVGIVWAVCGGRALGADDAKRPPNIVLILSDDLGVGELGCYGQKIIKTPNIDGLAREGVRFTSAYSPSPVCGPTRCSLLTGLDLGHSFVKDNREIKPEGQEPLPGGTVTVAELLRRGGYATACVGKWGLGMVGTSGDPLKQGFDFFYGQNCQRVAHNHYADHVWRNEERVALDGNVEGNVVGKQYVPDLMAEEAVGWLKGQKGPFFLYFTTPLPHVSLQIQKEAVAVYAGKVGAEKAFVPKKGDYVGCDEPHATYAAMVTRIDDYVGRILGTLKEMGVEENTIVIFASDNGPTFNAGTDSKYFGSAQGRRGLKQEVYEGGIRVPVVVRWPGHSLRGVESSYVTALYDLFPTFLDVAGVTYGGRTDGISLVPVMEGKEQRAHERMYWEIQMQQGSRALREGDWKLVQTRVAKGGKVELYNLKSDPNEAKDVSGENGERVKKMRVEMEGARERSPVKGWNFEGQKAGAEQ